MPAGPRILLDNVCYHIMVRGNQKRRVFKEGEDPREYLARLGKYKKRHGFRLYGFCFMPNHIHLLGEVGEKENLARFMHDLNRSYTAYFNRKYGKVGYLWQGRFKSKVVLKDEYLINCINYLELNPVRGGMVRTPDEYPWSSYKERNLGTAKGEQILDSLVI